MQIYKASNVHAPLQLGPPCSAIMSVLPSCLGTNPSYQSTITDTTLKLVATGVVEEIQ
jgi:hypothetical protein